MRIAETGTSLLAEMLAGLKARRKHMLPVLLLGVLALGLYIFFEIAEEMAEGEIRRMDEALFLLFRERGNPEELAGPAWLGEVALEITAVGGYPLIVLTVAAVAGLFAVIGRYGPAIYAIASVASGALLSSTLKSYYDRPRPDLAAHLDIVHTASFPSGHAMVTTVAYLTLASLAVQFFRDRRIRLYILSLAISLAVLVGISRIYLGVHWPSDVAAGWALGAAWASFSWLVADMLRRWRRRRHRRATGGGEEESRSA